MPHIDGLTIHLDPQGSDSPERSDSPEPADPFEGEASDSAEEVSMTDTQHDESPDPDDQSSQDGGDYDIEPTIDDEDEDWTGDRPEQAGGMQEEGEASADEDDPWKITIDGEPAFQIGGLGDDDLTDDDEDGAAAGPPLDDGDEGDAGSDDEDMVRLIDGPAARRELADLHPTIIVPTDAEMTALALVVRDSDGNIIDENHSRTQPWLSRFERARVLGTRASQLSNGAPPQIELPEGVIDSLRIANMELDQNQIPFIIRRPLPDGTSEYWPVHELEQLA